MSLDDKDVSIRVNIEDNTDEEIDKIEQKVENLANKTKASVNRIKADFNSLGSSAKKLKKTLDDLQRQEDWAKTQTGGSPDLGFPIKNKMAFPPGSGPYNASGLAALSGKKIPVSVVKSVASGRYNYAPLSAHMQNIGKGPQYYTPPNVYQAASPYTVAPNPIQGPIIVTGKQIGRAHV